MMDSADLALPLRIERLGALARRGLRNARVGRVAAVFTRSFYVDTADSITCVCTAALGPGPVNAVVGAPAGIDWRASGVRSGDRVHIGRDMLRVGGRVALSFGDARDWSPPRPPAPASRAAVRMAIDALERLSGPRLPDEGLGRCAVATDAGHRETTVTRMACAPIRCFSQWLRSAMLGNRLTVSHDLGGLEPLVGLGPGLTPSGDDFLAGAMIALKALGHDDALSELAATVLAIAAGATNPISVTHMKAAAEGQGHAALHDLLHAILAADMDALPPGLDAVARIGRCSGWDALAGLTTVLRAWTESASDDRRAA